MSNIGPPNPEPFKNIGEIANAIEESKGKLTTVCSSIEKGDGGITFRKVSLKGGGTGLRARITYVITTENGKGKQIKGEQ